MYPNPNSSGGTVVVAELLTVSKNQIAGTLGREEGRSIIPSSPRVPAIRRKANPIPCGVSNPTGLYKAQPLPQLSCTNPPRIVNYAKSVAGSSWAFALSSVEQAGPGPNCCPTCRGPKTGHPPLIRRFCRSSTACRCRALRSATSLASSSTWVSRCLFIPR